MGESKTQLLTHYQSYSLFRHGPSFFNVESMQWQRIGALPNEEDH